MMYPVLKKHNKHNDYIIFQKIAMPFCWSYLGVSDAVETFEHHELVFDPVSNSHDYFITPLSRELQHVKGKFVKLDQVNMTAERFCLYAGYFIFPEDKKDEQVGGFLAMPDTLLIDLFNAFYFALQRDDYHNMRAIVHAIKEVQTLYAAVMFTPPDRHIPIQKVKPYVL